MTHSNKADALDASTSLQTENSNSHEQEIRFKTKEEEINTRSSLNTIERNFTSLMVRVNKTFINCVAENPDSLSTIKMWLKNSCYMTDHTSIVAKITDAKNIEEIFDIIRPLYDCIDCELIMDMCEELIPEEQEIANELSAHHEDAEKFYSSTPIKQLKNDLENLYKPYLANDLTKMPKMVIKLQNRWSGIRMKGLKRLIGKMLPLDSKQSILQYIKILPGSVTIHYYVSHITADSLIEYTGGKLQFMRLIGIFSLYINDHPVLQEDENMNFTFELALLEAVTAANNEAVEFLLQLETVNIDHTNEEGKTGLMLACERGHEDIVHSLLSAGANVNIQDNKGWTALMRASKHNHISIIHMLLQANANPHLKKSNGSNALMIASFYGNYEVVELLTSKGVDYKYQREDGWNAFLLACENGHTQIVELLLKEQVDPNAQEKDGGNAFMLACQNGHTQIVELLLKEKVDPNVQRNDGGNAFMMACKNGHTQVVELLLKEQVDPNVQKKDGWSAFMLACQNGHTQIVELLLKEQVDPNVQEKNGWNAFMVACQNGHTQIVELLLKEQVDPNVQKKDGVTALMIASANGHYEVVKLLLEWKADPTIEFNNGITAITAAKTDVISALIYNYMYKKGNTKLAEDAASVYSFASQRTVSSGYHTLSDISSTRSFPSTLTLDSVEVDFKDNILK